MQRTQLAEFLMADRTIFLFTCLIMLAIVSAAALVLRAVEWGLPRAVPCEQREFAECIYHLIEYSPEWRSAPGSTAPLP
jgi:hypothetical protein